MNLLVGPTINHRFQFLLQVFLNAFSGTGAPFLQGLPAIADGNGRRMPGTQMQPGRFRRLERRLGGRYRTAQKRRSTVRLGHDWEILRIEVDSWPLFDEHLELDVKKHEMSE